MVLVKEDNSSALHSPLTKVIDVHPGKVNIVRVVTLCIRLNPLAKITNLSNNKFGKFKSSVQKLV